MVMDWIRLLSRKRLGSEQKDEVATARTDFRRDFDRIIFSSAFRRLQDKTQVFPLAESDYVRTRLTHSLEVSCVGRSLGTLVGEKVIEKHGLTNVHPSDFGDIVGAACLAHDIGNPPFGHTGEDAIREWFTNSDYGKKIVGQLQPNEKDDFLKFEGNAQGFRVIARLQYPDNKGGMQLTCATLAAFMKYPRSSSSRMTGSGVSQKKHGFVLDDAPLFEEVAGEVGLISKGNHAWCRHPLAFLLEAADDICYGIVDLEDGFRLGRLTFDEISKMLKAAITEKSIDERLDRIRSEHQKVEYLRARAINDLVFQVVECFVEHEDEILEGTYDKELISGIELAKAVKNFKDIGERKVYHTPQVVEIEAAGFRVLGGLLGFFLPAVEEVAARRRAGLSASAKSRTICRLIPDQFFRLDNLDVRDASLYKQVLKMTDYVSGMTDSFAVNLFKKLTGISLPSN